MQQKKALEILLEMMKKYPLTEEERDAVMTAVGILSWTYLGETRLEAKRSKSK